MDPATKIQIITTIVSAIIAPITGEVTKFILNKQRSDIWLEVPKTKHSIAKLLIFVIIGGAIGFYLISPKLLTHSFALPSPGDAAPLSPTPLPDTFTPTITPTPIPRGDLMFEINFSSPGEGYCNDYDSNVLGYDNKEYYIIPKVNGYIAVCHANDHLPNTGVLQVTAHPEINANPNAYYGFGVLFGWHGGGLSTSDACIFGVRRELGETQALFIEIDEGKQHSRIIPIPNLTIDNNPHTLRLVLLPDGTAKGYLDEKFIADYTFSNCKSGPIGMVAWGTGDFKVYFDDLKFFSLPSGLETLMQ